LSPRDGEKDKGMSDDIDSVSGKPEARKTTSAKSVDPEGLEELLKGVPPRAR
jgi:hypothetical protein